MLGAFKISWQDAYTRDINFDTVVVMVPSCSVLLKRKGIKGWAGERLVGVPALHAGGTPRSLAA